MSGTEEREQEERTVQGLGELPEDLEESRWPEGPGAERDEISRWTDHSVAVPAADLLAARVPEAPGIASRSPVPEISKPVFQLLPEGSHPWTVSSDDKPRQSFYQDFPWTFEIENTSGYESVLEELDWSLLPLTDVVQLMDLRLSAFLMGAPALGLQNLPVGQSSNLKTQLRIPTAGKLSIRIAALKLPLLQPAPLWTPTFVSLYRSYARIGEKIYMVDESAPGGLFSLWSSGDWGNSWTRVMDLAPLGIPIKGNLALVGFDGILLLLSSWGPDNVIWGSGDGGISWEQWIGSTTAIDAAFVGAASFLYVDKTLCVVYWNGAGYTTFSSKYGRPASTWTKTVGNVLPVPPAPVPVSGGNPSPAFSIEYAGRIVVPYGMTSATGVPATEKLMLAWTGDKGRTWTTVSTNMPFYAYFNAFVHGDKLWFCNGEDVSALAYLTEVWWTDDLLNFHQAPDVPWSARALTGMIASEDHVLCFGGLDFAAVANNESWSGGMLYPTATTVLHPALKARGFYLPPRT